MLGETALFWLWERDSAPKSRSNTAQERIARRNVPRVREPLVLPEEMGTFALRSPGRPNPIALTLVKIVRIDHARVYVDEFEAYDGTPVLDIKPYLPNGDRVDEGVCLPPWFEHLLGSRPSDRRFPRNNP